MLDSTTFYLIYKLRWGGICVYFDEIDECKIFDVSESLDQFRYELMDQIRINKKVSMIVTTYLDTVPDLIWSYNYQSFFNFLSNEYFCKPLDNFATLKLFCRYCVSDNIFLDQSSALKTIKSVGSILSLDNVVKRIYSKKFIMNDLESYRDTQVIRKLTNYKSCFSFDRFIYNVAFNSENNNNIIQEVSEYAIAHDFDCWYILILDNSESLDHNNENDYSIYLFKRNQFILDCSKKYNFTKEFVQYGQNNGHNSLTAFKDTINMFVDKYFIRIPYLKSKNDEFLDVRTIIYNNPELYKIINYDRTYGNLITITSK